MGAFEEAVTPTNIVIDYREPFMLFNGETLNLFLIILIGLGIIAYFAIFHRGSIESTASTAGLIGLSARVVEPLAPEGRIEVRGELWKAKAREGIIGIDERVEVLSVEEGLVAVVKKSE